MVVLINSVDIVKLSFFIAAKDILYSTNLNTVRTKGLRTLSSPSCFHYLLRNNAIMILQSHFLFKSTVLRTRGAY